MIREGLAAVLSCIACAAAAHSPYRTLGADLDFPPGASLPSEEHGTHLNQLVREVIRSTLPRRSCTDVEVLVFARSDGHVLPAPLVQDLLERRLRYVQQVFVSHGLTAKEVPVLIDRHSRESLADWPANVISVLVRFDATCPPHRASTNQ